MILWNTVPGRLLRVAQCDAQKIFFPIFSLKFWKMLLLCLDFFFK